MYYQIAGTNVRIMGTIHLFPFHEPPLPIPSWASAAEKWASKITIEADKETFKDIGLALPGVSARQNVPPLLWSQLAAFWPPGAPLERYRLWALMLGLGGQMMATTPGMESYFLNEAAKHAKVVGYLETAAEFSQHAESVPQNDLIAALSEILKVPSLPQTNLEKMYAAWVDRDIERLYDVVRVAPMFQIPSLNAAMLRDRNRAWTPAIKNLVSNEKNTLIAVGAMHLVGPGNVLECLGLPYDAVN
ncbi:hypothetical protein GN109_25335 [Collimonas pratensis]|uniref:TraB/GumN family protein n=1 Tax=Collimonas pratensis TaxID=279113 RepID=UPI00143DEF7D|nr:TraB/GumN family protein [Collimonas pratensis]NKI72748.1 hypothetical protein [Collimonas pratensis]